MAVAASKRQLHTKRLLWVVLSLWWWLAACGRTIEPETACSFVQNGNGQRVSWKSTVPVRMSIHSSVPREHYAAIYEAADNWNQAAGRELIVIEFTGVTGSSTPNRDGVSLIYWLDSWEADRSKEQARTTVYWSGTQIYEADVRLNAQDFVMTASSNPPQGQVHLQSLVVHEFGHVLGLAHTPSEVESVMNFSLKSGTVRDTPQERDLNDLSCEY